MNRIVFSAVVALIVIAGRSHAAAIAYDTLGPSNSFQGTSWLLGSPEQDQDIAQAFQCWQGGDLESITLAVTHYAFENVYDVRLHADNCGQPGAVLQSWLGVSTPADSLLTLTPSSEVALTRGINYWVAVSTPLGGANTVGGWNYDTIPGNNQFFLFSQHGGAWNPQCGERCALRVAVVGAPPPTCVGDLDGDGVVGIGDLAILLSVFGSICP